MQGNEVTTGREINSYQGDPGLGTGEGAGYKEFDLSPLQTYALKKYETRQRDYEQQQKDKAHLMEQFSDPALYQFVDPELAAQIDPKLDRLKELGKMNLELKPNTKEWYEFHDMHNQIIKDNAEAKVVMTLKDKFKKESGESADPHEKERMNAYVAQLARHKLGEEIPAYNKYHKYDDSHMPTSGITISGEVERVAKGTKAEGAAAGTTTGTSTTQRINGNNIEKVKVTMTNPMGLLKKYNELEVTDPQATETWSDVVHTTLETNGVGDLNNAMLDVYSKSMRLNVGQLQQKYGDDYKEYVKKHTPAAVKGKPAPIAPSFKEFMNNSDHGEELQNVYDGNNFLKEPLTYVSDPPGSRELKGFTYVTDAQNGQRMRLSKSDKEVAAIFGATRNMPGIREDVSSEVSKLPAEIAKLKAETGRIVPESKAKIDALNALAEQRRAAAHKYKTQTAAITPLPPSELPLIGREATLRTLAGGEQQLIVSSKSLPESLRKRLGFKVNSISKQVDYQTAQMRFFDSKGNDVTGKAINKMRAKGTGTLSKNIIDAVGSATANGLVVKFIDQEGKIIGTTEELDKQTLEEDLKATGKGDPAVGTNLPTEEE